MQIVSLIAATDESSGLGINNQLLCHLPADLQHFKAITMGKPIIMGRNTFESIGRPLPGRLNIVLSKSLEAIAGTVVVNSLDKAIMQTSEAPEIMIIGGEKLFTEGIKIANRIYLTLIHHHFVADVFFPKIDELIWTCRNKEFRPHDDKNVYDITFYTFERTV